MASQITAKDRGDEQSSRGTDVQPDDEAVEAMLKHKAAILERFARCNDGREPPSVEARCRVLRQKIRLLEDEISEAGQSDAAYQYLKTVPESMFRTTNRQSFLDWLNHESSTPNMSHEHGTSEFSTKRKMETVADEFNAFSIMDANPSTYRSKRSRTNPNEKPPCLRCRILKKKCDSLDQCSHCPAQSVDNETDYWKILGCFRGHLRDLSVVFCPQFSRSTRRTLKYQPGETEIINFVLTKSRVSDQKRKRMMHLVRTRNDFARLEDSSWEDNATRESLSIAGTSFAQHDDGGDSIHAKVMLEDYEAAWAALQAVSMDRAYLSKTAYNLFSLIRQGNAFSKTEPTSWELFKLSKRLLRQSVELYLLERLCAQIASGDMAGKAPFDPTRSTPNTLVLVDLKEDVEQFLRSFEKTCAGRAKLTGSAQIACLYSLLIFGVAKGILTDAYSNRTVYEDPNPWNEEEAIKIASGYKTLVSVFCWSSKSDAVFQNTNDIENNDLRSQVFQTQRMVRSSQWVELGFKGVKEFMLSLGTCLLPDGSYNGFFPQKFGLGGLPKASIRLSGSIIGKDKCGLEHDREPLDSSDNEQTTAIIPPDQEASPTSTVHTFVSTPGLAPTERPRSPVAKGNYPDALPGPSSTTTFTFVAHDGSDGHAPVRTHGGRKGALPPATLKKSREVRKLGACWNCWVMKMPCSEGPICDRCRKKAAQQPYLHCNRAPFAAYVDFLFPDWITSEVSIEAIKAYIANNTRGFTNQMMDVNVTSWADNFSMTLSVHYFNPIPHGPTQKTFSGQDGQPLGVESLPVGILDLNLKEIAVVAMQSIDLIMQNPLFPTQILGDSSSNFTNLVFNIVFDYYSAMSPKDPLVHDCFVLVSAIRSINRPVMFTPSSATQIIEKLHFKRPAAQHYSSRLLNIQTKAISYHVSRQATSKVLAQLEKAIKSRDKLLWPICFAAILLLCYCMEQMQALAGAHVQAARVGDPKSVAGLEKEPQLYWETVDGMPYAQLTHLFHTLYRTGKGDTGGLNPFREDFASRTDISFDATAVAMISEIKKKVMDNVDVLHQQDIAQDILVRQDEFSKNNSGRLMAKFLLTFKNERGTI